LVGKNSKNLDEVWRLIETAGRSSSGLPICEFEIGLVLGQFHFDYAYRYEIDDDFLGFPFW